LPIFSSEHVELPFSTPTSLSNNEAVDGVSIKILNCFVSGLHSILTGTVKPLKILVFLFISSTTSLIFIPVGPTAGPRPLKNYIFFNIGGPPLAAPPVTRALTITFPFSLILFTVLSC